MAPTANLLALVAGEEVEGVGVEAAVEVEWFELELEEVGVA